MNIDRKRIAVTVLVVVVGVWLWMWYKHTQTWGEIDKTLQRQKELIEESGKLIEEIKKGLGEAQATLEAVTTPTPTPVALAPSLVAIAEAAGPTLEERVSALETRVAALEGRVSTIEATATPTATPTPTPTATPEPADPLLGALNCLGFNSREKLIEFFSMEMEPAELHACDENEPCCVAAKHEKDEEGHIAPFLMHNPTTVTFNGWRANPQPDGTILANQAKVPPGTWLVEGIAVRKFR